MKDRSWIKNFHDQCGWPRCWHARTEFTYLDHVHYYDTTKFGLLRRLILARRQFLALVAYERLLQ